MDMDDIRKNMYQPVQVIRKNMYQTMPTGL